MPVSLTHPGGLLQQSDYAPVATSTGARTIFIAGQAAVLPSGEVTASDVAGQVHAALHNVAVAVTGAGGRVADVARMTIYVVGWTPDLAEQLFDGTSRAQASDGFSSPLPPITVIGVQALWTPELLVEIEATAVVD